MLVFIRALSKPWLGKQNLHCNLCLCCVLGEWGLLHSVLTGRSDLVTLIKSGENREIFKQLFVWHPSPLGVNITPNFIISEFLPISFLLAHNEIWHGRAVYD